ncbi:hypothetical protein ACFW4K_26520 [Nocardiopsis alba]|uniref:hypothetical protein n=1 Tax=Nocardiopsis alba TaxID=53437 RepID=UPI00366AD320
MPIIEPHEDARRRCLRTVAQGAIATGLVAAATAVTALIRPDEPVDPGLAAIAAVTAAITAAAAYVQRRVEDRAENTREGRS